MKKFLSISVSIFLIFLLLPLMLIVSLLILLIDGNPILFSQKRAGLNDIEFSEVSTSIEPIPQAAQTMVKDADYLQRLWQRMITS